MGTRNEVERERNEGKSNGAEGQKMGIRYKGREKEAGIEKRNRNTEQRKSNRVEGWEKQPRKFGKLGGENEVCGTKRGEKVGGRSPFTSRYGRII